MMTELLGALYGRELLYDAQGRPVARMTHDARSGFWHVAAFTEAAEVIAGRYNDPTHARNSARRLGAGGSR